MVAYLIENVVFTSRLSLKALTSNVRNESFQANIGRKRQKQTKQGNEKGDRPRLALKRTSFMNYLYRLRTLSGKRNSSTILTKFKSNYGTSLHELRGKSQHVRLKSDSYGTSLHELREKSQHVRLTSDM